MGAPRSQRHALLTFRNCRQVQNGPTILLQEMSNQIIHVQALRYDDYGVLSLVVEPG